MHRTMEDTESSISVISEWLPKKHIKCYLEEPPSADRVQLLLGIADGLAYLHRNAVVHGDMKPENIVVDSADLPCLIDFGLATVVHDNNSVNHITTTSNHTGTVRYMAPELFEPEQFGASSSRPSYSSDVYALALIMWEILSSQVPYNGRTKLAIMWAVINNERPPRPESTHNSGMSDAFWVLIEKCWSQKWRTRLRMPTVVARLRAAAKPEYGVSRSASGRAQPRH